MPDNFSVVPVKVWLVPDKSRILPDNSSDVHVKTGLLLVIRKMIYLDVISEIKL